MNIPLLCDADTGYGNQLNVRRTVREYERAGVAARTESFLDGVAAEMTAADLVVSRAGATTLAEVMKTVAAG